jgi:hypothetical protein
MYSKTKRGLTPVVCDPRKNTLMRDGNQNVDKIAPYRSMTRKKAKEKRKLVQTPGCNTYFCGAGKA